MPDKCCVPGCRSNYRGETENVSVFRFPADPDRKQLWLKKISRPDFIPSKRSVVCAKHFVEQFIVKVDSVTRPDGSVLSVERQVPKLKNDAYPSILLNCSAYLKSGLPKKRRKPNDRNAEEERHEQSFVDWLEMNRVETFSDFVENLEKHSKDEWFYRVCKDSTGSNYITFFYIHDTPIANGKSPPTLTSIRIYSNLQVEVFLDSGVSQDHIMVEFRVLRCAQCQTFQVLQVTKSPKWKCKLCGEKQSVLKEYGRGTGADCRRHVQKLNSLRMEIDSAVENIRLNSAYDECVSSVPNPGQTDDTEQGDCVIGQRKFSQWEAFLDKDATDKTEGDASQAPDDERDETGICFTTDWSVVQNEQKQAWKNKRKMHQDRSKRKKTARYEDDNEKDHNISVNNFSQGLNDCLKTRDHIESSWEQGRAFPSNLLKQDITNHTQSDPMWNRDFSLKSSVSHGTPLPSVTTHISEKEEIDSNQIFPYNGSKKYNVQNNFVKSNYISAVSTPNSTSRYSPNVSNVTSDPVKKSVLKASKWSTFITVKSDQDDSNDDSDNDNENSLQVQGFGNKCHINSASSSFPPSSFDGSCTYAAGSNAVSKWNSFTIDDDFDCNVEDEDHNEICRNFKVNSNQSEKGYHNRNSRLGSGDRPFSFSSTTPHTSKPRPIENNNSLKVEHFVGHCVPKDLDCVKPQSTRQCGKVEESLFQIVDDENDVWNLDL